MKHSNPSFSRRLTGALLLLVVFVCIIIALSIATGVWWAGPALLLVALFFASLIIFGLYLLTW